MPKTSIAPSLTAAAAALLIAACGGGAYGGGHAAVAPAHVQAQGGEDRHLAGKVGYVCLIHPGMAGTITVVR